MASAMIVAGRRPLVQMVDQPQLALLNAVGVVCLRIRALQCPKLGKLRLRRLDRRGRATAWPRHAERFRFCSGQVPMFAGFVRRHDVGADRLPRRRQVEV